MVVSVMCKSYKLCVEGDSKSVSPLSVGGVSDRWVSSRS